MNRSFYNTGDPFLYNTGAEPVGSGMDCLPLRQSTTSPFHVLISEQAKSLVALQELQNEVGALLEFRDLVMETFPNLRTKLATPTTSNTMTTVHSNSASNIPISIRPGDWTPGIRVRKKITNKDELRSGKKSGEIAVQDSGFSTETSSKETHSACSTAPPVVQCGNEDGDDELWSLLDLIHRKGTRLKDDVEALLQCSMQETNFQRVLFHGSADDVRELRQERDLLLDRMAEMEAEMLAGRVHTSRLQEDLESLLTAKQDLEEQLKAVVSQRGAVNSRIHDLHAQFVTKHDGYCDGSGKKLCLNSEYVTSSQRTLKFGASSLLDAVLDYKIPKVKVIDGRVVAAILKEHDILVLKRHLLRSTIQNQVLKEELKKVVELESGLRSKLDKTREENEELRFQLEDKNIELEGTRARVRVLEQFQKPNSSSPDIIPTVETPSRSEITTASMKAMSPLQLDHSSSTESAHDHAERRDVKRRPSKIPLKSYTAPKPPSNGGGKQSPAPARSRSGDRPNSAQLWKNSQTNSLNTNNGTCKSTANTPKSRNSSLVSAKDSLSCKLRSSDSLSKLSTASSCGNGGNNVLLKKQGSTKWGNGRETQQQQTGTGTSEKINSKRGSPSPWIHSSFNSSICEQDSLDRTATDDNSQSQHYQTANTFLWNTSPNVEFYDSIDSNLLTSSSYQMNGEELAEYDSLDGHLSNISKYQ